jgi:glucose/arabinose dehydrogenase
MGNFKGDFAKSLNFVVSSVMCVLYGKAAQNTLHNHPLLLRNLARELFRFRQAAVKLAVILVVIMLVLIGYQVHTKADPITPTDTYQVALPMVQNSQPLRAIQINVEQVLASGFNKPVEISNAGDGSGRLFVVEQPGVIKIIEQGNRLPVPYLDIQNLVEYGGERGLLGLAFHPNYESNGYFYVDYTRKNDGATVIMRYQVSAGDPNQADPNSASLVITIDQPYANHNGGKLAFGPDGYLYIAMGDGGDAGDPHGNAQNTNSLLGKILRLDVDSSSPYAIPPDNPFASGGGRGEVWDYGLRNPWRFSFDKLTHDIYIGDVGQGAWEEIDFHSTTTPGGVNFGWNCFEGFHPYKTSAPCNNQAYLNTMTMPVAEYNHSLGNAVTGGYVYRGTQNPDLIGWYFYGDYGYGRIWSIYHYANGGWSDPLELLHTNYQISTFGEDEQGELYVADYGSGTIYHLMGSAQP